MGVIELFTELAPSWNISEEGLQEYVHKFFFWRVATGRKVGWSEISEIQIANYVHSNGVESPKFRIVSAISKNGDKFQLHMLIGTDVMITQMSKQYGFKLPQNCSLWISHFPDENQPF